MSSCSALAPGSLPLPLRATRCKQIDIVELEPAAAKAARFFDSYTRKVLDDPRVHLIIGDGRNRLLGNA